MSPKAIAPEMQELTQAGVTSGSRPGMQSACRGGVDALLAEAALGRHRQMRDGSKRIASEAIGVSP
jgi:hypothetical protein